MSHPENKSTPRDREKNNDNSETKSRFQTDNQTNENNNNNESINYIIEDDDIYDPNYSENKGLITQNILQKNSASLGLKNFQHVTLSHENCHTEKELETKQTIPEDVIEGILKIIKDDGGQIALNYALQLAIQKSETVKEFLKNGKLTQRENRKVKYIFTKIVRDENIQVIKRKPQVVVKWNEKEETSN